MNFRFIQERAFQIWFELFSIIILKSPNTSGVNLETKVWNFFMMFSQVDAVPPHDIVDVVERGHFAGC